MSSRPPKPSSSSARLCHRADVASVSEPLPILRSWLDEQRVGIDENEVQRLAQYLDRLLATNRVMNLTRITDPDDAQLRLLADSLDLLRFFPDDARTLVDVGSGGGVPGLPLAIARPDLHVTLVDATAKKVRFLDETASDLGLDRVAAIKGRAEELGRDPDHRDRYDIATARAVARLVTLVELVLPLVRPGGVAILPKGPAAGDELGEAEYAIRMLGGQARLIVDGAVEGTRIVVIDKRKPTPEQFPRRTGVPNSTPLLGPRR